MSKNMQLTVIVRPYYEKGLKGAYPNLARHLGYLDLDLVEQNPSLYELVGNLDRLLYRYDGTPLKDILFGQKDKLRQIFKDIQENIACWNLGKADKLLYSLEDIFDEIEMELD